MDHMKGIYFLECGGGDPCGLLVIPCEVNWPTNLLKRDLLSGNSALVLLVKQRFSVGIHLRDIYYEGGQGRETITVL
jgi:hypothetical protein